MKRENFYRRNPGDALAGMVGMTLEERGVYNTIIDLIYLTWRPLEDSRQYIASHCGCAVQKLNPIIERLIAKGKLVRFEEHGCWYLSNRRFEDERTEVKGDAKTRSGRGEVGEKSPGVSEKSAGVRDNPPVLATEGAEIQELKPLDRVEVEEIDRLFVVPASPPPPAKLPPAWKRDQGFIALWNLATDLMRKRAKSSAHAHAAWQRAKRGGDGAEIIAGMRGYLAKDPDVGRTGGPGLHIWLNSRAFETYAGSDAVTAQGADWPDSRWAMAVELWRTEGSWGDSLGPPPGQPGCRVPVHLLIQKTQGSAA